MHILLLLLTVGTTAHVGILYYVSFATGLGTQSITADWVLLGHALVYSAAVLGILGAHEMGHYVACRIYNVDATLPFFHPLPLLSIYGTHGAVIKIR